VARRGESPTLAHEIQLRLRDEILRGLLQPGERLMASEHGARLGVSQSVIREALMRLVQQRLVLLEDNHGFRVASVSPKDLNDLTVARELNESAAIVLSIENGGVGWESEVVAAHHRLSITPMRIDTSSPKRTDDWLAAHREFHNTLYEACDNPILFQICESLADRAELYRRWSLIDPASPNRTSKLSTRISCGLSSLVMPISRSNTYAIT
jgi:DNA-binding GntR family transcriptional regulator